MRGEAPSCEYHIDSFSVGRESKAQSLEIHTVEKKTLSCAAKDAKSFAIWRKALSRASDKQLVDELELLSNREVRELTFLLEKAT